MVESTYNWYWLVDGLMAAGYPMHAILRSIELSPVRARMVEAPGDYPWSSYRANALGHADPVVSPHSLYAALADSDEGRRCAYRTLFADSLSETVLSAIREATNGGFVLGSGRFERQIAIMVGRRTWRGQSGRLKKQSANSDQLDLPI